MSNVQMPETEITTQPQDNQPAEYVKVGMSTCGIAAGADEVFNTFKSEFQKRGIQVPVTKCGCIGACYAEPLVEVKTSGLPAVRYGRVNKDIALYIITKHLIEKQLVNGYIYDNDY
jgi:(2Fe-2S) ferredoxin